MKHFRALSGLFVALLFVVTAQTAMAQSTIFNIPTTDTVDKGKAYFEFDFLPQALGPDGGIRTYIYNPRLVVGAPGNVEFGVNFPISHAAGNSAYIQPNMKWKYYKNDDVGVALAGGVVLNTPLNNRNITGTWAYFYTEVSKKVKSGNYGPRLTAGPYGVASQNGKDIIFTGPKAGAILGYEQPIHPKASIVADWFSGKNGLGYFTPGISITLPRSGLLNAGYSFGNDSFENSNANKNRYVFVYYGVTF